MEVNHLNRSIMIYSVDNRFVSVDGNCFERKVKSLTFQVSGAYFPTGVNTTTDVRYKFLFSSSKPNSVTVNYGDGTSASHAFGMINSGLYQIGWNMKNSPDPSGSSVLPPQCWVARHNFTDGNAGVRDITFSFEFPQFITKQEAQSVDLYGNYPIDARYFNNLSSVICLSVKYLTAIPDEALASGKLDFISFGSASPTKLSKLPESLFTNPVGYLNIASVFNLSDLISSNLFKLNQLKDTLVQIVFNDCDITVLDDTFSECQVLKNAYLSLNKFTEFCPQFNFMPNLGAIHWGTTVPLTNTNWGDLSNLQKVNTFRIGSFDIRVDNLHNDWKFLFSLTSIQSFQAFVDTTSRFNSFIDSFYLLCTNEGSITAGGSDLPYINRFRNMSWGSGTLSFTGAKVAPSGYVQGSFNGNPTNQGEKVYVLQNQYNHTITHA